MACKFPGAPDLASFWRLLETGGNAITEGVPGSGVGRIGEFYPESARDNPACRFAALVDDIDLFDAEFFRISPVEARCWTRSSAWCWRRAGRRWRTRLWTRTG